MPVKDWERQLRHAFVAAGANLVICARDKAALEATVDELKSGAARENQVSYLTADISQPKDVEQLVKFALKTYETVDILVNNAGVYGPKGCLEEIDVEDWLKTMAINLYGPLYTCRALLPHFKEDAAARLSIFPEEERPVRCLASAPTPPRKPLLFAYLKPWRRMP